MQKVWVLLDSITEGSKIYLRFAPFRVSQTPFPWGEVLLSSASLSPFLFLFPSVLNSQPKKCLSRVALSGTQHPKALKCAHCTLFHWYSQTCNPSTSVASTTVNMSLEASKPADKTFNFLTWMLTVLESFPHNFRQFIAKSGPSTWKLLDRNFSKQQPVILGLFLMRNIEGEAETRNSERKMNWLLVTFVIMKLRESPPYTYLKYKCSSKSYNICYLNYNTEHMFSHNQSEKLIRIIQDIQ